jgi:hypothetical protein
MKQMDTMLFQQNQSIDDIKNRLNFIESGSFSESGLSLDLSPGLDLEQVKPALMADNDFVSGIVDNIMTNSNLSEIIEQIDTVQTENRELRELLHAQQKTINEMNVMLLKIISQSLTAVPALVPALVPAPAPALVPALVPAPAVALVPAPVVALVPVPKEDDDAEDDDAEDDDAEDDDDDAEDAVVKEDDDDNIQLDVVEK